MSLDERKKNTLIFAFTSAPTATMAAKEKNAHQSDFMSRRKRGKLQKIYLSDMFNEFHEKGREEVTTFITNHFDTCGGASWWVPQGRRQLYSSASAIECMFQKRRKIQKTSQGIQVQASQRARMTIACGGLRCILSPWVPDGRVDTFSIGTEVGIITTMVTHQSKNMK
jgi:hypothetical protein